MGLESSRPTARQTRIQLFICHSSDDGDLADRLRACIEAGVDVSRSEIRCTSADGGKLNLGDPVAEVLRRDLEECSVVIGVLTHVSVDSRYVLMELGAAWMANKAACLLLAPGLNREHIPEPFQSIHVMRLNDYDVIPALLKTVSDKTERGLKEPQPSALKTQVDFERAVKRLPCWRPRLVRALPYGLLAALGAGFVGNVWLPNPPRSWLLNSPRYPIHLYTGTEGGQFQHFGTWLADKMKSDEHAEPTIVSTGGSAENCERIAEAGASSVALAWTSLQCAATDTTPTKKAEVIAALFPEVLHVLVHKRWDAPDQVLPDLREKKVYFGSARSGTRLSVERLLSKSPKDDGRPFDDREIAELIKRNDEFSTLSFSQAADRLRNGELDVAFIGTGLGAPAVTAALQDGTVRLVSLPPLLIENMVKNDPHGHYRYASLATNDDLKDAYQRNTYGLTSSGYSSLDQSAVKASQFQFDSYASDAVLLASEAVDKEFIEQLLETLYHGNRSALLKLGVSATYLDQRKLLNKKMIGRGMRVNGSVEDWESHCFSRNVRRIIWHLGGALLVFVAVTVLGALLSVLPPMGKSKVFGRRTRTLI